MVSKFGDKWRIIDCVSGLLFNLFLQSLSGGGFVVKKALKTWEEKEERGKIRVLWKRRRRKCDELSFSNELAFILFYFIPFFFVHIKIPVPEQLKKSAGDPN